MSAHLYTQITKRIEALHQELDELKITRDVLARFNGDAKLDKMDKHVVAAHGNGHVDARQEAKRKKWRETSQAKRDARKAAVAAAEVRDANTPPPPFDLNTLPLAKLRAIKSGKTTFLARTRPLLLLDAMQAAGIAMTHKNVQYVYRDVLKWGNRPLSQAPRYKLAKQTAKGWRLLPTGEEHVARAKQILEAS